MGLAGLGNLCGALLLAGLLALVPLGLTDRPCPTQVDAQVWEETADGGEASFLVILRQQADLREAANIAERAARGRFVFERLRATATRTQAGLRGLLTQRGAPFRAFYVVNALAVTGDRAVVAELAGRPEVARIVANPAVRVTLPQPLPLPRAATPSGIEWNLQQINADDVWALGYTGQGVVVAGQDTGYDWGHPALIGSYRGWNGITATHDYNWHDAIHENNPHTPAGNPCGFDSPEPCDDNGHGTHTMGTIVGDDGAGNQTGVAPGARWIGCRNMEEGWGTPASYIECFEFFLAPYPVGGDPLTDGQPELAPHVINNSWVCPPSEGCDWDTLQTVVENVRAAGILVVASAGNEGPACSTVQDPPAIYGAAFSVGATNSADAIASFSSRGPVTVDGSGRHKPDISAPGVSIRSSLPGGAYGSMSGTSMAGPHVAGVAALLWSAAPNLIGDIDGTAAVLEQSARHRTTSEGCGGDGPQDVPNNVYGWGIVDALTAVERVRPSLTITKEAVFLPGLPAQRLAYTLVVTNTSAVSLTNVVLTDAIPSGLPLAWASGVYTEAEGVVTWAPEHLTPGGSLTATLVVTVAHLPRGSRVVNERYGVRAGEIVTPVMGTPIEAVVPWRVLLVLIMRHSIR